MHFRMGRLALVLLVVAAVAAVAIGAVLFRVWAPAGDPRGYVLMATTTSTRDTGLLPVLLPAFAASPQGGFDVQYLAVGTGLALDAGRRGDVDVVMVHAPALELRFLSEGHGTCRNLIMYNRFVVIGPTADPAGLGAAGNVTDAFRRIHDNGTLFLSRGDNSGTHNKELEIWEVLGLDPAAFGVWYEETDQGMGSTLTIANERDAYTLSDDGTWYALEGSLGFLAMVYGVDDPILRNQYSVIPVNPAAHPAVLADRAMTFARWTVGAEAQRIIADFRINGHQIFTPNAADNAGNPEACPA